MTLPTIIRITAIGTALITALSVCGAPVTPEAALGRIEAEAPQYKPGKISGKMHLVHTHSSDAVPMGYVFAGADGFAVAPANDAAPALLGYGTSFDPDNIPDNMRWWLGEYAREIEWLTANGCASPEKAPILTHEPVAPLVKTRWDQGAPYNRMCPKVDGIPTYTGCMATSMAQVINCHRPAATPGRGIHTYEWGDGTLSFDYGTAFDWDNMLDTYTATSPEVSCDAVASLMYACGVSVNMNYSTTASGSTSPQIVSALVNRFGLDRGADYVMRGFFPSAEWDAMIYAELEAGRPVIYNGQSATGGHSFVCDGYDRDGYYHFNWGWSGLSDGYFRLTLLNPGNEGAGGSGAAYNTSQEAIIGISLPREGTYRKTALYVSSNFAWLPQSQLYGFSSRNCRHRSSEDADMVLGLRVVAQDGTESYHEGRHFKFVGTTAGTSGCGDMGLGFPAGLEAGVYRIYPVARFEDSDIWQPVRIQNGLERYVVTRLWADGKITHDAPPLWFSEIMPNGRLMPGKPFDIDTRVSCNTETVTTETVRFLFVEKNTRATYKVGEWRQTFERVTDRYYRWSSDSPLAVPAGEYVVHVLGSDNYFISDAATIRVGYTPSSDPTEPGQSAITDPAQTPYRTVDVYNLQGMLVRRGVMADEATQGLPAGIYIVDGKKISVK